MVVLEMNKCSQCYVSVLGINGRNYSDDYHNFMEIEEDQIGYSCRSVVIHIKKLNEIKRVYPDIRAEDILELRELAEDINNNFCGCSSCR